jgi:hypothetical protein
VHRGCEKFIGKHYTMLCKGLEHPRILVSWGALNVDLGTQRMKKSHVKVGLQGLNQRRIQLVAPVHCGRESG